MHTKTGLYWNAFGKLNNFPEREIIDVGLTIELDIYVSDFRVVAFILILIMRPHPRCGRLRTGRYVRNPNPLSS